nr:sensor histidine kinase [Nocardioides perillae]
MAVTDAEEAERARIAQDLHDGVGQSLTAVLLELAAAERSMAPEERAAVAAAREGVRAALEEVRVAARRLRPHVLEDLGLRSALVALTTDLFAATDVAVHRAVVPGLPAMSEATELVVFRVAQEALTNVARHADARTVRLRLGPVGAHVELVVEDDGRGVDPAAPATQGTGLRGMAERAAGVGGSLSVTRREGGGTRVRLLVPAAPPAAAPTAAPEGGR